MAIKENIGWIATLVGAFGGWELVKWFLNRDTNKRIGAAQAFEVEYKALIEDYHRVQSEVDELKEKVDQLYDKLHTLENERLDLIKENNELRLALKEAEKHVCLQPDDKCLQRLGADVNCRLRDLLRGKYAEDHPDAIITEKDMKGYDVKQQEKENDGTDNE